MAVARASCYCFWPTELCQKPPSLGPTRPPPLPLRRRSVGRFRACCNHSSLSSLDQTVSQIENSGIIACLRANSPELAMEAAAAALRAGISVLEIVKSTPGVFEVLHQLVRDYPAATFGVGTILTAKDAQDAIVAGAKFLMSPAMVKDVLFDVQDGEVVYIPGVMTPTEILSAYDAGARIVKH